MIEEPLPLPEYPRPSFVRPRWMNLNGIWKFAFDHDCSGEEKGWHEQPDFDLNIRVPYVHQAPLSGIGEVAQIDSVWYARELEIPPDWLEGRVLLHFGAADYQTTVWVNGREIGSHSGGFTPFSFDITDFLNLTGNRLTVRCFDPVTGAIPSGKQTPTIPHGCVYTRSTGIWQTVWLEAVPEQHLGAPWVRTPGTGGDVLLSIPVKAEDRVEVLARIQNGKGEWIEAAGQVENGQAQIALKVPDVRLWGPGAPHLYDMELQLRSGGAVVDTAQSYIGFRDVAIDGDRILLNGRPWVSRGILDQGYWPEGIYTHPSGEELREDIIRSQKMGFDSARLHQKVFDPQTLYWADRLGYLLWGEFPDWGLDLKMEEARENYRREWCEAVLRDRSHPSVIIWTPFNERDLRGDNREPIDFIREIVSITRTLDPDRPVASASGWQHVQDTDIVDFHDYAQTGAELRDKYGEPFADSGPENGHIPTFVPGDSYQGQPVIASEVGGIWWDPEQTEGDDRWGYGDRPRTEEEFLARYRDTMEALLSSESLNGFVYTQLTDVEQEVNGLYTYNRKPKFDADVIRSINTNRAAREEN